MIDVEQAARRRCITLLAAALALTGLAVDAEAAAPVAAEVASRTADEQAQDTFEGAIGLVVRHSPSYTGASAFSTKFTPAGFIRWGRVTITGAGGFTTRRRDDVERGMSAELAQRGKLRLSLGLRYDPGRQAADSPRLAGMGDVRSTLRTRLAARWDPEPGWRVTAGISIDALHRAGGYFMDAGVSREWDLGHGQGLIASASVSGAGDRFMQAWHGVTRQQAVDSGYPEFKAREGLRDAQVGLTWRVEFAERWAGFVGVGHAQLLGSAKTSPLTFKSSSQSVSGGLAWRF